MKKLVELRSILGITQEELAISIGVSRTTVVNWESGDTIPQKRHLDKLLEKYGVPAAWLFSEYVPVK